MATSIDVIRGVSVELLKSLFRGPLATQLSWSGLAAGLAWEISLYVVRISLADATSQMPFKALLGHENNPTKTRPSPQKCPQAQPARQLPLLLLPSSQESDRSLSSSVRYYSRK